MTIFAAEPDALHHCRRCRWSYAHSAGNLEPLLWCDLRQEVCKAACPGFERYGVGRGAAPAQAIRPQPIGACHYCGEHLRGDLRWCDRECEAGWEYEFDRMVQNRRFE